MAVDLGLDSASGCPGRACEGTDLIPHSDPRVPDSAALGKGLNMCFFDKSASILQACELLVLTSKKTEIIMD